MPAAFRFASFAHVTSELLSSLASGAVLGLSAGAAPGPLTALLVGEALRHGRDAGLKIAFVPLFSDPPIVLLSVLALSRLSDFGPILGGISLFGGLFVARLAYESWTFLPSGTVQDPPLSSPFRKGIATNLLNPHPYLFWISVGAPLMLRTEDQAAAALFAAAFYVCLIGSKVALALLTARFRSVLASRFYLRLNRTLGLILLFFALVLLKDGLRFMGWLD